MQLVLYNYTFSHVLLYVRIISQHGSAAYVGMVVVVCMPYIIQWKTAASNLQSVNWVN